MLHFSLLLMNRPDQTECALTVIFVSLYLKKAPHFRIVCVSRHTSLCQCVYHYTD